MLQYLVILGALANLLGSSVYIKRTLEGRTKPNRVTFFIWAFAPIVAVPVALSGGAGWAVLPVIVVGVLPLLIFLASFVNPNAYWELKTFDYVCGAAALVSLVVWIFMKNPGIAMAFLIAGDALATMPTLIKAWRYPKTEYWSGYAGALVSGLTGLAILDVFTFTTAGFLIYLVLSCAVILIGIFRGRFHTHTLS